MTPEEIEDLKAYAATNKAEYLEALADANKQVADLLVRGYDKDGNLNQLSKDNSYDELYKFAKAVEYAAEALKRYERDKWEAKKAGITL